MFKKKETEQPVVNPHWEYKLRRYRTSVDKVDDGLLELKRDGLEGWELVSTVILPFKDPDGETKNSVYHHLKRKIGPEEAKMRLESYEFN